MQERIRGNEYRTTLVCIDTYKDGVPVGRFYNPYLSEGESFCSLTDFLLKMERTLDDMKFPQSFTAARNFTAAGEVRDERSRAGQDSQRGALATFALRIIFRQNSSWQGSASWLEAHSEQSFRSVLELILLMDSALRNTDGKTSKAV